MPKPKRPDFTHAVEALIDHASKTLPEFRHIDVKRILIVAGEARRASRGTIKPLCFSHKKTRDSLGRRKPVVKVRGVRKLYAMTLRPLFFRKATPRERISTVLHELFHISTSFDGTLDHRRRHAEAGREFERAFEPIERKYFKQLPLELLSLFSYSGEVRIQQWLERPQSWHSGERASQRLVYTEEHLFEGIIRMKTVGGERSSSKA